MKAHFQSAWYRVFICALAALLLWAPGLSRAAFYQKDYAIAHFRGQDVLCDPYVVRENDYVIKLLKQRGDIAHKDFPRFLEIFKHINPDIRDMDLIYPNQKILVPLRILEPGTLDGQESGQVSMPVITITDLPEALKRHSDSYEVRYGDWVSRLIAERFGRYGSESYQRGVELFRRLNPDIHDLDRIMAGTEIRLPDPEIRNQPWYENLFEEPGAEDQEPDRNLLAKPAAAREDVAGDDVEREQAEKKPEKPVSSPPPVQWFKDLSVFARAAEIVDAELMDEGHYFFPRRFGGDFRLDLSRTPVVELKSGIKVLFTRKQWLTAGDQMILQDYWPSLEVVFVRGEPELLSVLEDLIGIIDPDGYENRISIDDGGVLVVVRGRFIYNSTKDESVICLTIISEPEMRTPTAVCDYLARHAVMVKEWVEKDDMSGWLLKEPGKRSENPKLPAVDLRDPAPLVRAITRILGYRYHENIEVSFPYAGFQVKATTDMLSVGDKAEMLVDYGSLQGDAVESIEKSGFRVLQLKDLESAEQFLDILAGILPVSYEKDPMFWTANRPRIHTTSVQIPGWLVSSEENNGKGRLLLCRVRLADSLINYLRNDAGVNVVYIPG